MESRGVPAVVLVTTIFDKLSQVVARSKGFEDLERYILPHPLNPLPEQDVRRIARENLPGVVGRLLKGA